MRDNFRGDDSEEMTSLIVPERRLRRGNPLDISPQRPNDNSPPVIVSSSPDQDYNFDFNSNRYTLFSDGIDEDVVLETGKYFLSSEDSEILDLEPYDMSPVKSYSATFEDSDPEHLPLPLRRKIKNPRKRRRTRMKVSPLIPQSGPKKRSKRRNRHPSSHEHAPKDHLTSKKKWKWKWKLKRGKKDDKDQNNQQGTEEEPLPHRKRKKNRKHVGRAAKHEPLRGSSRKRRRKNKTRPTVCPGTTGDVLRDPTRKTMFDWIFNLFRRKPAALPTEPRKDPPGKEAVGKRKKKQRRYRR